MNESLLLIQVHRAKQRFVLLPVSVYLLICFISRKSGEARSADEWHIGSEKTVLSIPDMVTSA